MPSRTNHHSILHVCKKYPPAIGGDAVVVSNLVRQQSSAGQTVNVLTSKCPPFRAIANVYRFGLTIQPAALDGLNWRRLVSLVSLVGTAFRVIKQCRPNLIHTHSIDLALAVAPAARWFGVPMVHTFHILTFPNKQQASWRRLSELWLARLAGLRIVTAPNAQDVLALRQRGFDQAHVLPNGIDIASWSTSSLQKSRLFTFLAVGRLEAQKGYEYLINAADQLIKQGQSAFKIIIIGDGSLRDPLTQLIKDLKLTSHIQILGQQDIEATKQAYAAADCMIITSLWETTPLTLLEAWAMQLPVIATPVGLLQDADLAARTVVTVPIGQPIKLAQAMAAVLNDTTQLQPLVHEAKAELCLYDWPIINRQCQQLYDQVVG